MAHLLSGSHKITAPTASGVGTRPIHLMSRLFNTPLMIHRPKLDAILRVIGPRIGLDPSMYHDVPDEYMQEKRAAPEEQTGPVAVIPVYGSLVKRGGYLDSMSGITSYDSLRADVQSALGNSKVKSLLFDFDSPGGEAAGLFDFAAWLSSIDSKPMIGISNDMAYSACYALASCMDQLFVTGVGGVGSIGVYTLHVDQSAYDNAIGVKYTYISSGDKKVDGNPHEPLDKSTKAEMQAHVDQIRDMFVNMVAENREVDPKLIYDTEAALYMGEAGCPLLADAVCCFDEAMACALDGAKAKRSVAMPSQGKATWTGATVVIGDNGDAKLAFAESVLLKDIYSPKFWGTARRTIINLRDFAAARKPNAQYTSEIKLEDEVLLALRCEGTLSLVAGDGVIKAPAPNGRISGILAPYGRLSCDLGGFREEYRPGCFKASLESGDPLILAYHDPSKPLGRQSVGTAKFWEDSVGLHYEAILPDTQVAKDLKVSVERGDVQGASAAFFIEKYHWETRGGDRVRVVEQAELVEGSPHSFTAYNDTTATAEQAAAAAHDELTGVRLRLLGISSKL